MALEQPDRVVVPENIHEIAADIRRQALQHPDRDPVVPGAPRPRTTRKATRTTAKRKKAGRTKARAKTTKAKSRTTRSRKAKSRTTKRRK